LDGIPEYLPKKRRTEPQIVALKKFKNSETAFRALTDEVNSFFNYKFDDYIIFIYHYMLGKSAC
jgi:hypothetical protein